MKLMLAGKYHAAHAQFPKLVSPKLDGIRAYVGNDGVLYSRTNKPIPSREAQRLFGRRRFAGVDGELIAGPPNSPDAFRRTTSAAMSVASPGVGLYFWAFDFIDAALPFEQRLERAAKRCDGLYMRMVPHEPCANPEALQRLELSYVTQGFEGVMLRDPQGKYKHGRSTSHEGGLLKLKRFEDSEAVVIGYEEMMHNANEKVDGKRTSHKEGKTPLDVLGALKVRDLETDETFSVGSGFTAAERKTLWASRAKRRTLLGRIIKYKYFPTGGKSAPRFPTFLGFRED